MQLPRCTRPFLPRFFAVVAALSAGVRLPTMRADTSDTYLPYLRLDLTKGGVQSDLSDVRPYDNMHVGGHAVSVNALPRGLLNHPDIGIVTPDWVTDIQVIQRFPVPPPDAPLIRRYGEKEGTVKPFPYVDCPRMVITPEGDYLLAVVAGWNHYGYKDPNDKFNDIFLYRSHDRGRTWTGPFLSTRIPYNQHAWVPLVPSGSPRIYMFSTEPAPGDFNGWENAGIGVRHSDDDGHTWSEMTRINPVNDPGFQGMFCIRATETARGTWLMAPHEAGQFHGVHVESRLYVLRSEDRGQTWNLVPGPRPAGWQWEPGHRLDEGRPMAIGNRVIILTRTFEGHLWRSESGDDGKTWSEFKPTPLVHPDAPPMVNLLSDGKTIIALTHNRPVTGPFSREDRSELWISLSRDTGLTWSEPRFLTATSVYAPNSLGGPQYVLTYSDIVADHGMLNIFIPHLWRQVLYIRLRESDIDRLPTRATLFK